MKRFYLPATLICLACTPEQVVETSSAPRMSSDQRALSDSEIVAACEHRTGARLRLYGCKQIGPQRIPLFVVDGRVLPTDTIGPGKHLRERVLADLGSQIENIEVLRANDSTAVRRYGKAVQFGVIEITLLPAFRRATPS